MLFRDVNLKNILNFLDQQEEFVFLDTSQPDSENDESLLFVEPVDRLICRLGDDIGKYLNSLERWLDRGYYLAGWFGYEFGVIFGQRLGKSPDKAPDGLHALANFAVFPEPYRFNHRTGDTNFPAPLNGGPTDNGYKVSNLRPNMAKQEFLQALDLIHQYIVAGDTYQVNYTMKLLFDFAGSAAELYRVLRRNQSVAYGAYIHHGMERILSFSPELFFRKETNEITVRPMKGTATRGRNSAEEAVNSWRLHHDHKNRSENVMIVDLLRNDLACLMHGYDGQSQVLVESLFDVESYESLLQMTSTIKAKTVPATMKEMKITELLRALFPCGSITGAPKIRTMQIIDELEHDHRGVYTGAIGYFAPDGLAVFNIPIRTVRLRGASGEMGVGAGITHDSIAEEEWDESLLKGRFLTHAHPSFQLFETILWLSDTGFWLLDEHLLRLQDSAYFLKFSCDITALYKYLRLQEKTFSGDACRVRLVLEKDGRISHTTKPCAIPEQTKLPAIPRKRDNRHPVLVDFSSHRVDSDNPWLFHKTTMRQLYDRQYKQALDEGLFDYLFCNIEGEVTEGCIGNIIIYTKGRYKTPPVKGGLLPGIMRAYLLADKGVNLIEEVLTEQDVRSAEALFVCNSVRGLVRAGMR